VAGIPKLGRTHTRGKHNARWFGTLALVQGTERERLWTLPNIVSLSRLGLAAAFVVMPDVAWRLGLVGVASTTDYLDGWLARRRGGFSRWGAIIDPVSDRAFVVTSVVALWFEGVLGTIAVGIFISRDVATAVGFAVARYAHAFRAAVVKARVPGKVVTVLQFLALVVAIAAPRRVTALIAVLAVASAIAMIDYTRTLWSARAR
jgi:cardiolipin synthase